MSAHMSATHLTRRASQSSGSQPGSHTFRVEKPRIAHNAAFPPERRRTTTGSRLYATLDDHYNMMMGFSGDETIGMLPAPPPARPMSWHPSSTHLGAPQTCILYEQVEPWDWLRHYPASSRNSGYGSDTYTLPARDSMSIEPPQNCAACINGCQTMLWGSEETETSWPTPSYAPSLYSTPALEPMPWYLDDWTPKNQAQTQPVSNECLPIPGAAPEQDRSTEESERMAAGKELVGMGLYDLPHHVPWDSSLVGATGKGLKLEETWQPPEEDDEQNANDDDDDDDDDDDESSEEGEEDLPPPPPTAQERPRRQFTIKPPPQASLNGQSFFEEEDDTVTTEWWYQQLRRPSLPVQDAGIGYGWL